MSVEDTRRLYAKEGEDAISAQHTVVVDAKEWEAMKRAMRRTERANSISAFASMIGRAIAAIVRIPALTVIGICYALWCAIAYPVLAVFFAPSVISHNQRKGTQKSAGIYWDVFSDGPGGPVGMVAVLPLCVFAICDIVWLCGGMNRTSHFAKFVVAATAMNLLDACYELGRWVLMKPQAPKR